MHRFSYARLTSLVAFVLLFATTSTAAQEAGCVTEESPQGLADRASPLDSLSFSIDGADVKVCYGRPSARGRTMIGGDAVPFGRLWRTGANEPTMIHTPVALSIAGIHVDPGTYSLYTVPGENEWGVIVNRSVSQWGHEGQYTPEVEAEEVARSTAPSTTVSDHVEQYRITFEDGHLVLAWEYTRVRIPVGAEGT